MKIFKKFTIFSLLFMLICLTACDNANKTTSDKDNTQTKTATLEEVNVVLDWYPNAVHTFIYDAVDKGYYEKEGLKVNIVFPANVNDGITLTAAGKAQIGVYYPHDAIQARADQNVPIKIIGSIVQSPLNIVLSLQDKNITSPKDFVGKTIGYGGTVLSEEMIKSMMKNQGVDYKDTKFLDVGFDLMSSMTTNKVDATIGCLVNHEVPQMEEEGFKLNYFTVDQYGVPSFPELVFLASDDMLKNKKDVLEKFLRASKKGFDDMKKSPDETLKILLNNQNKENFPLSEAVEKKSMATLLPVMENEKANFLSINKEDIQKTIDWMKSEGIIKNDIKVEDVVQELSY